jgi:hypothetical protein
LTDDELLALMLGSIARPIQLCRIERSLAEAIGATTNSVWLSRSTIEKQLTRHRDMDFPHYRMLPIVLGYGAVVQDRPRHLTFVYPDDAVFGWAFKATVKTVKLGHELYLVSYHKIEAKKAPRLLQRGALLRKFAR